MAAFSAALDSNACLLGGGLLEVTVAHQLDLQ